MKKILKGNILSTMRCLFIVLFFSLLINTFSQERELNKEILVYILADSLELPDGSIEVTDVKKLKIKSKSLDKAFKKIELKSIKKAFPEFNPQDTIKTREDGKRIKLPNMSRIFQLKLKKKDNVAFVIEILSKEKGVLFAETHMKAELFGDDDYGKQWYLNNTGQSGGTNDADIYAEEAWQIYTGSSSVKIGVIDIGVDLDHEDLSGKTSGDDEIGDSHGTHVAGIAAAKANNTHGGRGVDWNAKIISKRIFDNGGYMGDVNAYNKTVDAVNSGADILNHSWGGSGFKTTVMFAFAYAYKNNRLSVVAMGNTGSNTTLYPAAYDGVLAVGSTTHLDERSPWEIILM